jgi:hypothetical protein
MDAETAWAIGFTGADLLGYDGQWTEILKFIGRADGPYFWEFVRELHHCSMARSIDDCKIF